MSCPYANKLSQNGGSGFDRRAVDAPNFSEPPNLFSSPYAKVKGVGCAGTKSNSASAAASYVPYSQLGGTSVCLNNKDVLASPITGVAAGHATIEGCPSAAVSRTLGMDAGKMTGGKKRKTMRRKKKKPRKSRKTRKSRRTKKYSRGKKSKTHKGKDFETRKKSKMYRTSRFRKFLKNKRLTMLAPDFPFAGGKLKVRKGGKSKTRRGGRKCKKKGGSRRIRRGGAPQPYSNIPLSFGYALGAPPDVNANHSALANPPPQNPYNHCQKNTFKQPQ